MTIYSNSDQGDMTSNELARKLNEIESNEIEKSVTVSAIQLKPICVNYSRFCILYKLSQTIMIPPILISRYIYSVIAQKK